MKKTNAFQFFNKDYSVKEYSDMYKKLRLDIRYTANVKREQIFVKLFLKTKIWCFVSDPVFSPSQSPVQRSTSNSPVAPWRDAGWR